jgi:hypothetical protein
MKISSGLLLIEPFFLKTAPGKDIRVKMLIRESRRRFVCFGAGKEPKTDVPKPDSFAKM